MTVKVISSEQAVAPGQGPQVGGGQERPARRDRLARILALAGTAGGAAAGEHRRELGRDEFVRRVAAIPDALADNHFKSQHALLYERGVLMVDEVGRFEQLDAHWTALAERFGLEPGLRVSNVSKGKRGNDDFREYYTEELVQLVYERYRKDVHTFGYEADHQALLAFVRERQPAREQRPS
mgnify:CR=1 FL=1